MKNILFTILAFCFCTISASAQIYGGDISFYIKSGDSSSTKVYVVEFNGSYAKITETSIRSVRTNLSNNPEYYHDFFLNDGKEYVYNSKLSTTSREVYKAEYDGNPYVDMFTGEIKMSFLAWAFFAFSPDKESLIRWEEVKSSGQMRNKVYYKKVDENYFFPENDRGRYDFLN